MEIADSARRHGVEDEDIRHAVRVPFRRVRHGDERVLIIGPDRAGRLLEVVASTPRSSPPSSTQCRCAASSTTTCEAMTMPRTREQLEQAAAAARAWLDSLDPATSPAEDPRDLRRIGLALGDVAAAERELADAVAAARANGRSWGEIALALGISKQAARERYSQASPVM